MEVRLIDMDSPRKDSWNFLIQGAALSVFLIICLIFTTGPLAAQQGQNSPSACLDILKSSSKVTGGLKLGRVFWDGEIMEPVLLWKNEEEEGSEYSFRNCSDGVPLVTKVKDDDLEFLNSALVARFSETRAESLPMFSKVPYLGYDPAGKADFLFRGTGGMLEARRLNEGYVEITGTDSVQIFPVEEDLEQDSVSILLVATRATMKEMEPTAWDGSWGTQPEDRQIQRKIIWWELASTSGSLKIHPAVSSFADLTNLVATPVASDTSVTHQTFQKTSLSEPLKQRWLDILPRSTLALVVLEEPEHIDLAENMLKVATEVENDTVLDVALLEKRLKKKDQRIRIEGASTRGRFWPLIRLYDLAAIMPERITGKVRLAYYQSVVRDSSGGPGTRFFKNHVTLKAISEDYKIANAFFQDQAAGMARMTNFMGCILKDSYSLSDRGEVLKEGLKRMDISFDILQEMDVNQAFRYLFQGLNLPAGLRAGERNFLRGLKSADSEIAILVRSLKGYFDEANLEPEGGCDIALVPDNVFLSQETPELVAVVPSLPQVDFSDDAGRNETLSEALYREAQTAKKNARLALAGALHQKGARHTRRKIIKGHNLLDQGDILLTQDGRDNESTLRKVIQDYEKAMKIFVEAKETAFRIEHSKPKLRVH